MSMRRRGFIVVVGIILVALSGRAVTAQTVYWTDDGIDRIQQVTLGGMTDLVTSGLAEPRGIALDVPSGHLYWADRGNGTLRRANLDGTGVTTLVSGLMGPAGIALDLDGGRIYWVEMFGGRVARANLDGTGVQTLVSGVTQPFRIALDLAGGRMYWTEGPAMPRIRRANLDGTVVTTIVSTGLSNPRGIAIDVAGDRIYWADFDLGEIRRAGLDGSTVEVVIAGQSFPTGLTIDAAHGKVYWTDLATPALWRANLDGSAIEMLAATVGANPREIAVDPGVLESGCAADLDGSGAVGFTDLLQLLSAWGPCP